MNQPATHRLIERVRDLLHKRKDGSNHYDGRFRLQLLDGGYSCHLSTAQYNELVQLLADHDAIANPVVQPRPLNFIVELEDGCWIAPWAGDPGRTLVRENARGFATHAAAEEALQAARQFRPFRNGRIVPWSEPAPEPVT